ncbi:MAG: glycerophosphodiester phosphodiesterase family protein [Cyanobacteria bacterium P01_A01_bin.84]
MTPRKPFTSKNLGNKKFKSILLIIFAGITGFILSIVGYFYIPRPLPAKPSSFQLIAHRGVHQTFHKENLNNDTCTAQIIYPPTHNFLENTIPSIREAFKYGADMVEIDIHPTTDNQLAVFHDWTIDCRTNGKGITHEQSMKALKKLDIGYGYTPDNGKTFPFRGKAVGLMPTFDEIIQEFPYKKFLVDQKDRFDKTINLLANSLTKYPTTQRQNIYLFSAEEKYQLLKKQVPQVQKLFPTRKETKDCIPQYLTMLFSGEVSKTCSKYAFGVPTSYLKYIPGWSSNLFLTKVREAGLKFYVIEVDTKEDWEKVKNVPLDGIVTNRIELIAPLYKKNQT